jgi:hypothetical protein
VSVHAAHCFVFTGSDLDHHLRAALGNTLQACMRSGLRPFARVISDGSICNRATCAM